MTSDSSFNKYPDSSYTNEEFYKRMWDMRQQLEAHRARVDQDAQRFDMLLAQRSAQPPQPRLSDLMQLLHKILAEISALKAAKVTS